jgi:hypothetical protein
MEVRVRKCGFPPHTTKEVSLVGHMELHYHMVLVHLFFPPSIV